MKNRIVHCRSGNYVETWYDNSSRNWITQTKDAEDCQVGDSTYSGYKESAEHAHRGHINAEGGEAYGKTPHTTPTPAQLEALVMWPQGSVGADIETRAVAALLALCVKHGFGRIPQLAAQIEDLWRNPERLAEYQRRKRQHLRNLIADRKT